MRSNHPYERLIDVPDAPGDLRLALRAARTAGPDAEELRLLHERVHRAVHGALPLPSSPVTATRSAPLAKVTAIIALAVCGALLGRGWRGEGSKAPPEPLASDDTPPATTSEGPAPVAQATEVPSAPAPLPTASPKPRRTHDPTAAAVDPNGEARLLTLARAELKENPVRALTLAEEHAQRFAKGQLRAEREVIALTALVRLGRLEEATPRWQAFRVTFARSAYLPRLSTLFAPFDDSTEKNTALRPLTP